MTLLSTDKTQASDSNLTSPTSADCSRAAALEARRQLTSSLTDKNEREAQTTAQPQSVGASPEVDRKYKEILAPQATSLKREIAVFHRLGYSVRVQDRVIPLPCDGIGLAKALKEESDKFTFPSTIGPRDLLEEQHGSDRELPRALSSKNGMVQISPYSMIATKIDQKTGLVVLYDHLSGDKAKVVFRRVVTLNDQGEICSRDAKKLSADLRWETKDHKLEHFFFIEGAKHEKVSTGVRPAASIMKDKVLPHRRLVALEGILSQYDMAIVITPTSQSNEEKLGKGGVANSVVVTLTKDSLKRLNGSPILVDGTICAIGLTRREDKEDSSTDDVSAPPETEKKLRDKYGNLLISDGDIAIAPAALITDNQPGQTVPLNFDLSPLGLDEIPGLIYVRPQFLLAHENERSIYTNLDDPILLQRARDSLHSLCQGITQAEELFGFRAGEKVRQINLVNGRTVNAYFNPGAVDAITVLDEFLRHDMQLSFLGVHETVHLVDELSQRKLSASLKPNFTSMLFGNRNFLETISEATWLPGVKVGGHAWDGPEELVASLVNSLTHPRWEQKISEQSPAFRQAYLGCLKNLAAELQKCPIIKADAPIVGLLDTRIALLETNSHPEPSSGLEAARLFWDRARDALPTNSYSQLLDSIKIDRRLGSLDAEDQAVERAILERDRAEKMRRHASNQATSAYGLLTELELTVRKLDSKSPDYSEKCAPLFAEMRAVSDQSLSSQREALSAWAAAQTNLINTCLKDEEKSAALQNLAEDRDSFERLLEKRRQMLEERLAEHEQGRHHTPIYFDRIGFILGELDDEKKN